MKVFLLAAISILALAGLSQVSAAPIHYRRSLQMINTRGDNGSDTSSSQSSDTSSQSSDTTSQTSDTSSQTSDTSSESNDTTSQSNDTSLGLPSDGLKTKNGVPFGFLPDVSAQTTMAEINQAVGMSPASTYGWYAQITGSSWDGSQLLSQKQDIIDSKAVLIPAVMPTVDMSAITPTVARQVASVLEQFTDAGVEVWLRFAHEVNYYITSGTYHGNVDSYQTAWANIAAAVKDNPKIKMFWCPNWADASSLQEWFPKDPKTVDIVGMDAYPQSQQTFDQVYGSFYDAFATKYNKPFAIGETGPGKGDDSLKEYWLKQIAEVDVQKYPLYVAGCWFEYYKGFDFRIIMSQSSSIVLESKAELQS